MLGSDSFKSAEHKILKEINNIQPELKRNVQEKEEERQFKLYKLSSETNCTRLEKIAESRDRKIEGYKETISSGKRQLDVTIERHMKEIESMKLVLEEKQRELNSFSFKLGLQEKENTLLSEQITSLKEPVNLALEAFGQVCWRRLLIRSL